MGEKPPNPWEPDYWFLRIGEQFSFIQRGTGQLTTIPDNVLLSGRGEAWQKKAYVDWGVPDNRVLGFPWTSNNLVTPLVDGQAYMKDLYEELKKLQYPAAVLLAGWQFTSLLGLMGPNTGKPETGLLEALKGLIKKKCELRVLAWDNLKIPTSLWSQNNWDFVKAINQAYAETFKDKLKVAYLDANLDGTFLSHHQKEVVIFHPGGCCAYVGGIDLGVDRWDTTEHKKAKTFGTFIAWHDIQMKVQGDATLQLWANFRERWDNNRTWLAKQSETVLRPGIAPPWVPTGPGSHHVQVLRTVTPVRSGFRERTMPFGERTVVCALKKAISQAECYIYIEEQFLWDCELADFIAQRMQSKLSLRLIIVMAAETELPIHHGKWHFHQRSKFFMTVMQVTTKEEIVFGQTTNVYPYGLYREDGKAAYVHSKLVIIDDRYVAVGSANFDARSMWVDTELTLGIVDGTLVKSPLNGTQTTVCKFAQDLRMQLWSEHLVRNLQETDPIKALKFFPGTQNVWPRNEVEAQKTKRGHIQCYVNVPGADLFVGKGWPNILDPNERHFTVV